jgi:phosphate-selective porin OprO and OprP
MFKTTALALALAASSAIAGDTSAPIKIEAKQQTLAEQFENLGLIYKDKNAPILQEFWLLGRYHLHYHDTNGTVGNDSGWEHRRARFGFQATLFDNLTIHAQSVAGSDFDPLYGGFTELWASWKFSDAVKLTIGQQKHRFTHDRNVSSRYINYMERGMFTNMFGLDYTPAVTLSGTVGKLDYYTGVFSNATDTNMYRAFTELNSGWSYLFAATYDLGNLFGADTAHFYGSYIHSEADASATNLSRYRDGVSAALILTEGPASLVTEVTGGFGSDRGNAWGLNVQPSYFLTDNLQLVGRYQLAMADDDRGLTGQRRYERAAGAPAGDLYQAGYLGLNYYIAGHRAKIMTGVEYADMNGESEVTAFAGVRVFFGPHSKAPFPGGKTLKGHW